MSSDRRAAGHWTTGPSAPGTAGTVKRLPRPSRSVLAAFSGTAVNVRPSGHSGGMLLRPNVGHYDPQPIRRLYEGSSLEISTTRVRWTAPTAGRYSGESFDLLVGADPGEAHAVTHVRTTPPSKDATPVIDRYVVTDATGRMLGSFPSGLGQTGSAAPGHLAGWYPRAAVLAAVQDAGLEWDDRDFDGDNAGLESAFPGVVPHLRQMQVIWWMLSIMLCAWGLWMMIWPWRAPRFRRWRGWRLHRVRRAPGSTHARPGIHQNAVDATSSGPPSA